MSNTPHVHVYTYQQYQDPFGTMTFELSVTNLNASLTLPSLVFLQLLVTFQAFLRRAVLLPTMPSPAGSGLRAMPLTRLHSVSVMEFHSKPC